MKINKLILENINAIKGKWLIDFTADAFYQEGIFAILGATGAGKTTLLDAICLAIYGATPRLGKVSKSDNALMSVGTGECLAGVELSVGKKHYRFEFAQRRAKNKPDGALQEPTHQISEWQGDKFVLISEKKSHSERLASDLLGMDFTQFTRSVMLAQGSFSAFLQSKPEERGEILEKITGTDIYGKISIKIFETYRQKYNDLTTQKTKLGDIVLLSPDEFIALENELNTSTAKKEVLDNKINTLTQQISQKNDYDSLILNKQTLELNLAKTKQDLADFLPSLNQLTNAKNHQKLRPIFDNLSTLNAREKELSTTLNTLQEKYTAINTQKTTLSSTLQQQEKELNHYHHLEELLTHNPFFELVLHHQAQSKTLIDNIDGLQEKQSHIETLRQKETALKATLNGLTAELSTQNSHFQTLCQTLHQDLGQHLEQHLGQSLPIFNTTQTTQHQTLNEFKQTLANIANQERTLQQLQVALATFNEKFAQLSEHTHKIHESTANLTKLQNSLNLETQALHNQQTEQTHAQTLLDNAKQAYELSGEINRLSDFIHTLTDGTPCPLCGSQQHPYAHTPPDRHAEHERLYQQLKDCETKLKTAEQDYQKQQNIVNGLIAKCEQEQRLIAQLTDNQTTLHQTLEQEWQALLLPLTNLLPHTNGLAQSLPNVLSNIDTKLLFTLLENLKAQQRHLIERMENANSILKELETLNQKIIFSQTQLNSQQTTLQELSETILAENSLWKQKETLPLANYQSLKNIEQDLQTFYQKFMPTVFAINQKAWETDLTEIFATYHIIDKIYQHKLNKESLLNLYRLSETLKNTNTQKSFNILKTHIQSALNTYQHKKQTLNGLTTELSNLKHQLDSLNDQLAHYTATKNSLKKEYDEQNQVFLKELHVYFATLDEFLSAHLDNETITKLETRHQHLEETNRQCHYQLENATAQLNQLCSQSPDIDTWKLTLLQESLHDLNTQKETLLTTLGATTIKYEQAKRNQENAKQLANDIGKLEQELSDWALLNHLIGSADGKKFRNFAQSLTLQALLDESNLILQKMSDRYVLTTASDPKNILGIELIDTHQGDVVRQSKNLSGGESFLVSLSLALGLSALSSHNMQIDSLFLDEGFGTLDEEALDVALTALSEIQASGKMIGIISHVGALKERIGTQILVQKKGEGVSILSGVGVKKIP